MENEFQILIWEAKDSPAPIQSLNREGSLYHFSLISFDVVVGRGGGEGAGGEERGRHPGSRHEVSIQTLPINSFLFITVKLLYHLSHLIT